MPKLPPTTQQRRPEHDIEPIFPARWSPRAMNGQAVDRSTLDRLFEAARWAPSSYNEQPWRFIYAHRDSDHWDRFLSLLVDANQAWAHAAGVLVFIVTKKTFTRNGKPNAVAVFDAGAAWENLALQGARLDLVVHGMGGIHRDRVAAELGVPEDFEVVCGVAIGHPGDPADLPEALRGGEVPTGRKPIAEIVFEGGFVQG